MKKNKILVSLFLVVLVAGFASAFWPFESITGNVVDGDVFDNSDLCEDTDGGLILDDAGMVAARSFWGRPKIYKDRCYGKAKTRYLSDGTKVGARSKIREFYCENDSMKYETLTSEDLGEGYCVYETKNLKGKKVKVAKWIPAEKACIELREGVYRNELGKVSKKRCSGKNFYEYACSDTDEILESITACPAKCNLGQGGCFGECTAETDTDNDKDVPGSLLVDGEPILDQCAGARAVKQYKCLNNGLKPLKVQGCGTNRICVDSDTGSYCKDLYASADLTGTVSNLTGQTSGDLANLGTRVTALEGSVAAIKGCGYVHYKDLLSDGTPVSGMTVVEACSLEQGLSPMLIVLNEDIQLTNSEDCSPSYTIYSSDSSIIRPYSGEDSMVKLGEFLNNSECNKATFPDGSIIGDGYSTERIQMYEAVLCC